MPWFLAAAAAELPLVRRISGAMLRPQKLRPYERVLLCCFGLLLFGAGLIGALLAFQAAYWRCAAAAVAAIGLAGVYFLAAKRGKPL
jgi:hypothetical protein